MLTIENFYIEQIINDNLPSSVYGMFTNNQWRQNALFLHL